jgi:hypothetical protein
MTADDRIGNLGGEGEEQERQPAETELDTLQKTRIMSAFRLRDGAY